MAAYKGSAIKLIFEDGALTVESIDPPEVVPAILWEWPPTKFMYTSDCKITFTVVKGDWRYAKAVFMRGGGKCAAWIDGNKISGDLTFHPTDWTENVSSAYRDAITYELSGVLRGMPAAGQPLSDDENERYAAIYLEDIGVEVV
jgi:hypothetical protein